MKAIRTLIDISGQTFGRLTVIERAPNNKHGHTMWLCECTCGKRVVTVGQGLKSGNATSCGCSRIKDVSGQKFGMLTAIEVVASKDCAIWRCQCECGNYRDVRSPMLRTGQAFSCGCTTRDGKQKHGMTKHYLYDSYVAMRHRCERQSNRAYPDYGGRGIVVCDRWRNGDGTLTGFECFLSDMGDRPEGTSLDRIDANKGYHPENCRWATYKVQSNNRRNPVRNRHTRALLLAIDRHLRLNNSASFEALRSAREAFAVVSQTYKAANDNTPAHQAA